jgi:putative membrane protein
MDMWSGMGMTGFGLLMMLIGFVVVVAVIAAVVWAIVSLTARPAGDSARRTLDERYARGEIGDDEYQRMKRQLG